MGELDFQLDLSVAGGSTGIRLQKQGAEEGLILQLLRKAVYRLQASMQDCERPGYQCSSQSRQLAGSGAQHRLPERHCLPVTILQLSETHVQ